MAQLYSISFYICWRLERRPILDKMSGISKELINRELLPKLPSFGKLNPDIGNEAIKKFHIALANFHFEDQCIKANMVVNYPDNFAVENRKKYVIGQYRLQFSVYNKSKETSEENYPHVLPILINEMKKLVVQTDKAVIKVTGFRTHGQIKEDESIWPANASTEF